MEPRGPCPHPPSPHTFWPILVAKGRDTLIEQSLTLIEQPYTLIEQSSLSFLIVSKCHGVNLVRSGAADFDSCGMAKAGGYDLFYLYFFANVSWS